MKVFFERLFKISGSLILLIGVSGVLISIITSLFSKPRIHPTAGNSDIFLYVIIAGLVFMGIGTVIHKIKTSEK